MRSKQEVFNELYEAIEAGVPVSVRLQQEAHQHGIQVDKIEDVVAASIYPDEDYSDESI